VQIRGDQALLMEVATILKGLDIDWEQALSGLLGDTPAHLAGKTLRGAHRTMSALAARSRSGAAEYVREESGLGVSNSEAENWYAGVRLLAADTERLAARINRLAFRAGDGPDQQHDS